MRQGGDCRSVWNSELEKNHLSDQNLMVSIVGTWNNVEKKAHDEGPACEVPSDCSVARVTYLRICRRETSESLGQKMLVCWV